MIRALLTAALLWGCQSPPAPAPTRTPTETQQAPAQAAPAPQPLLDAPPSDCVARCVQRDAMQARAAEAIAADCKRECDAAK